MGSKREKSNIAITILKKLQFLKGIKKFYGSNNIFADCIIQGTIQIMCLYNIYFKHQLALYNYKE